MKKLSAFILAAALLFCLAACGGGSAADPEAHIYDNARVVDSVSGGRQKIGEISIVDAARADVTDEALEDWYFNYVLENDYDYNLIVYTDEENMGCYSAKGAVGKDVTLEPFSDETYLNAGGGVLYLPTDDGHLVLAEDDEDFAAADEITAELEALFPEEYREDYTFGVQVDPHRDGGVIVMITVDQESDDTDAAFALALEYYEKSVEVAEQHGESVTDYSAMVDNKGAPVGWYQTRDGVTYTDAVSGEQMEAPSP